MKNYVLAYYGEPNFESPEAGAKHMAKWKAWMGALGAVMINPGAPFGKTKTVSAKGVSEGGGANRLVGYSIVQADSMEAVLEMAKRCPHLDHGKIDVAEVMDMKM